MNAVFLIAVGLLQAPALMDAVAGPTTAECKAVSGDLIKQQMKKVNECTNSIKFKDAKEKKAKSSCIMKCVMQRANMLDAEGHVNVEESVKLLKENLPESFWERVTELLTPCQQFTKGLDPKDEFCKTYDPMIKCGTQAFTQLCKGLTRR